MTSSLADQFYYSGNTLHIESRSVVSIPERIGTPFYCYSEARLLENISRCKAAFEPFDIGIHYAMKANSNLHILRLVAAQGLGVDLVSGGELFRALKAGFAPSSMIFSGVGKTVSELNYAIENEIGQFNVESAEELAVLACGSIETASTSFCLGKTCGGTDCSELILTPCDDIVDVDIINLPTSL
mgnify:CR=1 FL=1